jgi:hypothetical protein
VTVVVLVKVAPNVFVKVVVARASLNLVLVGVGSVVVIVRSPDRTVGGGRVVVVEMTARELSVVVTAGCVIVALTVTGVSKVLVVVGASGARR